MFSSWGWCCCCCCCCQQVFTGQSCCQVVECRCYARYCSSFWAARRGKQRCEGRQRCDCSTVGSSLACVNAAHQPSAESISSVALCAQPTSQLHCCMQLFWCPAAWGASAGSSSPPTS
jgi:hypothetical protein